MDDKKVNPVGESTSAKRKEYLITQINLPATSSDRVFNAIVVTLKYLSPYDTTFKNMN